MKRTKWVLTKQKGWNKTIKGQKIYILKRRKNKTNTQKKKKPKKPRDACLPFTSMPLKCMSDCL